MILYREGRVSAFNELYARHESRLFSFLKRRISSDDALSLDVFQLTWLKVHSARNTFDQSQKFSNWLYTIAINTLRDELGEAWRRYSQEFEEDQVYQETEINSPLKTIELSALREVIESALQTLAPHQREAIILSDMEGFSSKEIAEMMKLSDGAVRQLIFRGRKELTVLLSEYGAKSA